MAKGRRKEEKPSKKKKASPTKERIRQVGNAYQSGKDAVDFVWDFWDLFS